MTNEIWQQTLSEIKQTGKTSKPRNMKVKEVLNGSYRVDMPSYVSLKSRKVNYNFMFAEAAWILSGSNSVRSISKYMKTYQAFSDDKVFMRGAYGPKVVDQLGYVVDKLIEDKDSRQAVINIWRERPGVSKDIPCTLSMQFLIRDRKLHSIVTMRSQDIILGFTYDVFTFSMIANSVRLLLNTRGTQVRLGSLFVNAGSLHLYEKHFNDTVTYIRDKQVDEIITNRVKQVMKSPSYDDLVESLWYEANQ